MTGNDVRVPKLRFPGFTELWKRRKIGDYYFFKNGLNKGKEYFGQGTPIVNFVDVFHNRGLTALELKGRVRLSDKEIKNFEVGKGDLIFTRTSETIDEIGYPSVMLDVPTDTVFSGFVLRGRALNDDPLTNVFKRYVFFTQSFRKEMINKSSMTTRALTSGTALRAMNFNFPSDKKEQSQIGIFFGTIDSLIEKQERKIADVKKLKEGLLQKMFPKNGELLPEIRFPGFYRTWQKEEFSDLLKRRTIFSSNDSQNPRVEYEDIISGEGRLNKNLDNKLSDKNGLYFQKNDIIFGKLRPYLQNWLLSDFEGVAVGDWWVLHPIQINARYAYSFIQTAMFREVSNITTGTKMPRSDWKLVSTMKVPFPSPEEQAKIGEFFASIDRLITLNECKLEHLQQLKKALLQQMFV